MSISRHTEVLVVGAGPVGLTTALLLAENGLEPAIIDSASGTAAHSYACALHPRTLELLDRFGLIKEILEWGRRIQRVAFCDHSGPKADVSFSRLRGKFPFCVVLPQNALEWLLERTLHQRAGIRVHWNHRFTGLKLHINGVTATIDELDAVAGGYAVPQAEATVKRTVQVRATFLVGADGQRSLVRRCLGFYYEQAGDPEQFAVYELDTATDLGDEARVVLGDDTASVLWPISSTRCRWTFQLPQQGPAAEFPAKERQPLTAAATPNQVALASFWALIRERAPWFDGKITKVSWLQHVGFERRLTRRFTDGRCWLAGDAAHQTSPIGVQSANIGLVEADELPGALKAVAMGDATAETESWNRRWRAEWSNLLGITHGLKLSPGTADWVRQRAPRIVPCCPASGADLSLLLAQLGLSLP